MSSSCVQARLIRPNTSHSIHKTTYCLLKPNLTHQTFLHIDHRWERKLMIILKFEAKEILGHLLTSLHVESCKYLLNMLALI